MPKAFNLLSKTKVTTNNTKKEAKKTSSAPVKETKSTKQVKNIESKKSTKPTKSMTTNIDKPIKRRGRPPKTDKVINSKPTNTKPNVKTTKPTPTKSTTKPTASIKPTTTTTKITKQDNTSRRWHNMETNKPEEFRPLEFNSNYKNPIYGYKLPHGIITNNPYYLNAYKKETGCIEWQYISGCNNLNKCPRGFPDCTNCEIYTKRQKELKKKNA
jgi:hypothetical protein